MRAQKKGGVLLAALLGLGAALAFFGVLEMAGPLRWDLTRSRTASLKPATLEKLARLNGPVTVTYYVSDRRKMPTALKGLKDDVLFLLKQMRHRSRGRLSFNAANPDKNPMLAESLGRKRISSFQIKTIRQDEFAVNTVWSGLTISYLGRERVIPALTAEHLPHLEGRIVDLLENMERKYVPKAAVSAPAADKQFRQALSSRAGVLSFDFTREKIPEAADILFLVQPRFTPEKAREIDGFLEDGRNVFLFFSAGRLDYGRGSDSSQVAFLDEELGLEHLLGDKGVEVKKELVLEESLELVFPPAPPGVEIQREFEVEDGPWDPSAVLAGPSRINLNSFVRKKPGITLFPVASPLEADAARLSRSGWRAEILAHTSEKAWTLPASRRFLPKDKFASPPAESKQRSLNLALALRSDEAWRGRLFLFSSRSLFSDSVLSAIPGNSAWLQNLVDSYVTESALLSIRSSRVKQPALKPLGGSSRLFWRMTVVLVVPALLMGVLYWRVLRTSAVVFPAWQKDGRLWAAATLPPLILFTGLAIAVQGRGWRLDLTEGRENTPAPELEKILREIASPVTARYVVSPEADLPLEGKRLAARVKGLLRDAERVTRGKFTGTVDILSPDDEERIRELSKNGVEPFVLQVVEGDAYREKKAYSALLLENAEGRREVVSPLDPAGVEKLEFLTAAALARLAGQPPFTVALVSDQPKVSPAEAHLEYAERQLAVPESPDVYSRLQDLLRSYGYRVLSFSPRTREPVRSDLLFILQPWVIGPSVQQEFYRHLRSGKNALVAAQHFQIQPRQYIGRGFDMVYWPRPHLSQVNGLLAPLGVELKEEVLFDRSHHDLDLAAEVRWGPYLKEERAQPMAQPFVIRALPAHFNKTSPLTARLSDQVFIGGNRFVKTGETLPPGLQWTELITTTEKSWALDWKGGFIEPEVLTGGEYFHQGQPLAALLEGAFPTFDGKGPEGAEPARLVLIGSSQMFQDAHLMDPVFRSRDLIMNAVVDLTHGETMARLHARGGPSRRGIGAIPPHAKARWRLIAVFLGPAAFAFYGLGRRLAPSPVFRPA